MPMLRRGYGAVKNLRCKSGARFPPSTDWMQLFCLRRCKISVIGTNLFLEVFNANVKKGVRGCKESTL